MKYDPTLPVALAILLVVPAAGPAFAQASAPARPSVHANTLRPAERAAGWRLLFDGKTTDGWRGYQSDTMPSAWKVIDGVLTKSTGTTDIVTKAEYQDFELRFDWRIGPGGNSGVFYRATEEYEHVYWSGPEYQLLDDAAAPDGKNRLTAAGADYALYPAPAGITKPANQWNSGRIIVRGHHVEHWMNGRKLLEYELGSPDWVAKVKASKFGAWPHYGLAPKGLIGIQGDHDGVLSLKNIQIRELP